MFKKKIYELMCDISFLIFFMYHMRCQIEVEDIFC